MSDEFTGAYAAYANPSALLSMPLVTPDGNVTHGSDSAETAPKMASGFNAANFVTGVLENIPILSDVGKTAANVTAKKIETEQGKKDVSKLVWSVILVVVGLMLLSRGFGLIGEEGESVVVNLSNPSKFPGIGHAIQGMKGKK